LPEKRTRFKIKISRKNLCKQILKCEAFKTTESNIQAFTDRSASNDGDVLLEK
jgi:hypothetical protein